MSYDIMQFVHQPPVIPTNTGRRARKREQVARHLTTIAFRLFETHGYEAVTMERIATEADVAKATLYSYFPVKESLLASRFREEIASGMTELEEALRRHKSFASRMRFLLQQSAEWHKTRRAYMPHYLRFRRSLASYGPKEDQPSQYGSGTKQILEELFKSAQESGEIRADYLPGDLAWMFEQLLVGAVVTWLQQQNGDLNEGFQFALDLLLEGIGVRSVRGKSTK
jgi:AcrR family transcriptional regulator